VDVAEDHLGALGDSFYEYLIKQWLITNKQEPYLREMFDNAMYAIADLLVQRSSPSGYVYIADWSGSGLTHKMDHLACFAGAMYAVGAQDGGKYDAEYMALAGALSETCYRMYSMTATGLSPEFVQVAPSRRPIASPHRVAPSRISSLTCPSQCARCCPPTHTLPAFAHTLTACGNPTTAGHATARRAAAQPSRDDSGATAWRAVCART